MFWLTQVLRILPRLGRPEHGLKVIVLRSRGEMERQSLAWREVHSLFISVSQRIKLLNLILHLWKLGQLLDSMSFSDIANNKGRFHCGQRNYDSITSVFGLFLTLALPLASLMRGSDNLHMKEKIRCLFDSYLKKTMPIGLRFLIHLSFKILCPSPTFHCLSRFSSSLPVSKLFQDMRVAILLSPPQS